MTIPESTWVRYVNMLSAINKTAARKYTAYLNGRDLGSREAREAAIRYAYALATRYGESAAATACEMYDAIAAASRVAVPAAVPAATADFGEVAKTVNGMIRQEASAESMGSAVARLVKRAGADTTLQNAARDQAEFAWIPHGDSCAFCLMLASAGWRRASKNTVQGGHADHIHANCDCTFEIRFNSRTEYAGYNPEKYREMFDETDGSSWDDKVNSIRRRQYAENSEEINAQKREAYAERKERLGETEQNG